MHSSNSAHYKVFTQLVSKCLCRTIFHVHKKDVGQHDDQANRPYEFIHVTISSFDYI